MIPENLVPSLFEPFLRGSQRSGPADGAGLGLSIVRSVAAAHRGHVTATSGPTGGFEVLVLLPSC